jgi:N-methylhydantoinase A/oxoprolinase/acetone carboxylase beta subunit
LAESLGTDQLIRYMDEPLASELGFQRVVIPPHPWRAVGTRAADEEIEPVNWKVSATATTPRVNRTPVAAPAQAAVPVREQAVRYVDAAATISTHHRDDRRRVEQPIHGPAIVTEMDATTFVPPTFMATVDVSGNLHPVRRDASGENP